MHHTELPEINSGLAWTAAGFRGETAVRSYWTQVQGSLTTRFGKGSHEPIADPASNEPESPPHLDRNHGWSDGCHGRVGCVPCDEGVDNIRQGFRGVIEIIDCEKGQEGCEEGDEQPYVQGQFGWKLYKDGVAILAGSLV